MKLTIKCASAYEARCCMMAADMLSVLRELDDEMRRTVKYDAYPCTHVNDEGAGMYNDTVIITTSHWRDRLFCLLKDYDVNLDLDEEVTP